MNYVRLTLLSTTRPIVFAVEHIALYMPFIVEGATVKAHEGTIIVTANGINYHVVESFDEVDKALVSDE